MKSMTVVFYWLSIVTCKPQYPFNPNFYLPRSPPMSQFYPAFYPHLPLFLEGALNVIDDPPAPTPEPNIDHGHGCTSGGGCVNVQRVPDPSRCTNSLRQRDPSIYASLCG